MPIILNSIEDIAQHYICNYLEEGDLKVLQTIPKTELIKFHHNVGRFIRNEYGLWLEECVLTDNNKDYVVDGIDLNPKHPDAVSMLIIERIWDIANEDTPD